MSGKGIGALLALATAAAGGAWLLLAGRGPGNPPSPASRPAPAAPAAPPASGAPAPAPPAASPKTIPGGEVRGVVLRDGVPAAAAVTARLLAAAPTGGGDVDSRILEGIDPEPRRRAEAGPDGRWSMTGLGAGRFLFEAAAGGDRGRETADLDGAVLEDLEIHMTAAPCSLRGRALGAGGSPWTGIVLGSGGWMAETPVRTDADGRFRLEGLPRALVHLAAVEPGRRILPGPSVLLPWDEEVVFTVGAGLRTVEGRVLAAGGGEPVPGATVHVLGDGRASGVTSRTATDAAGGFRVEVPPGLPHDLLVSAPGFLPETTSFTAPRTPGPGAPLEVRLQRGGAVAGRVLAEGTAVPVPGVRVRALNAGPEGEDVSAESDGSGRYVLRGLRPGPRIVFALGGGRVSKEVVDPAGWERERNRVEVPEGGTAAVDLVVVPAARVRGRVVDAAGAGAGGVRVRAGLPRDRERFDGIDVEDAVPLRETASGVAGSFEVPALLPGIPARFVASVDGMERAAIEIPPAAPGETVDVVLRLPAERRVTVRLVEDGSGSPIPGAEVDVVVRLFPGESSGLGRGWTTGEDGTAVVGPLPEVPAAIHVREVPGRCGAASAELGVSQHDALEIRVGPAEEAGGPGDLSLEGTVLLPDGTPAAGAEYTVSGTGSIRLPDGGWGPTTDFRGRFRSEGLPPGDFRVAATLERGGRTFEGGTEAKAGAAGVLVRLRDAAVEAAGLGEGEEGERFRVRVLGPDGSPVPGGGVTVYYASDGSPGEVEERRIFEGRSALPLPGKAPERAWVEVAEAIDEAGEPAPFAHGVFGPFPGRAGEVEVRLAAERAIAGRVVDAAGNGVEGAQVFAHPVRAGIPGGEEWPPRDVGSEYTGPDGRFRLGRLGDAAYEISVEGEPRFLDAVPFEARAGAADVLVTLRRAATAAVTVLGPDGAPVGEAEVRAGPDPGGRARHSWTGARGVASLEGLDPDLPVTLAVEPPRDRRDLLPSRQAGWKPAATTVRLARAWSLEVRVRDRAGRPVCDIEVAARMETGDEGSRRSAVTDAQGVALFHGLRAGPVSVETWVPGPGGGGSTFTTTASIPEAGGRLEIVLDPGGEAVLRPRGAAPGRWTTQAYFARSADPEPGQAGLGDDGGIHLRGLEPGEAYDVYVRELVLEEDGSRNRSRCALLRGVKAGDPPREIDLVEGKVIRGKAVLPPGAEYFVVAALLGKTVLIEGFPEDDGTFAIPGVPDGEWTVVVYLDTPDGKYHAATARCPAGGTVEIRVP